MLMKATETTETQDSVITGHDDIADNKMMAMTKKMTRKMANVQVDFDVYVDDDDVMTTTTTEDDTDDDNDDDDDDDDDPVWDKDLNKITFVFTVRNNSHRSPQPQATLSQLTVFLQPRVSVVRNIAETTKSFQSSRTESANWSG